MGLRGIAPFALIALVAVLATGCTDSADGSGSSSPSAPTSVATSAPTSPATSSSTSVPPPTTSSTPRPSTSSPSVATTGPNVRSGEKPPTLPAAGKQNSRVGAVEFATYWVEALDWAYATMDSTLARTTVADSCQDCRKFLRGDIDEVRQSHEHYVGGRLLIGSRLLRTNDQHNGATAVVDVTVTQTHFDIVSEAGKKVEDTPASKGVVFRNWLKWYGSYWKVVDWKEGQ